MINPNASSAVKGLVPQLLLTACDGNEVHILLISLPSQCYQPLRHITEISLEAKTLFFVCLSCSL